MILEAKINRMRLWNCPIGLFMYNGELCLKTEYYTNEKCECFIVSSGEFFCGGSEINTIEKFMNLLVFPIKVKKNE